MQTGQSFLKDCPEYVLGQQLIPWIAGCAKD